MTLDGMAHAQFEHQEVTELIGTPVAEDPFSERRLIVALDVPTIGEAREVVSDLGDSVNYYKIGLELIFAGGLALIEELRKADKWVFLDMKLLDISNTVEKAVANIARLDVNYLTIHGLDTKTLEAAKKGKGKSDLGLLAVTVLTHLTQSDLSEQSIAEEISALTLKRARLAYEIGFDGVIASGHEAKRIREATHPDFIIKTPGIRPAGSAAEDQERVMTPRLAISNGADFLVVGRPIIRASDPKGVAESIKQDIDAELEAMRRRGG